MKVVKTSPGCNLFLGHQGEKLALQIVFDIAPWLETYGFGTAHLLHQRKGDAEPYPVATTQEGNEVWWDVSNSDTAVEGAGRYELHFYTGETLVKSVTGDTLTAGALQYGVAPPEPVQLWLDHVAEKEHELFQAVDQSTAAAQEAKGSATAAAQSEAEAKEAAKTANTKANTAADYARNALDGAANAYTYYKLTEKAETSAQNAANSAAASAEEAKKAAEEAKNAGGSGSGVEVTAKPGQLIRVKETDENGKPTAWEAVPWGYTEGGMVEILPETTLEGLTGGEAAVTYITVPLSLEDGARYTIVYNGKEYNCTAHLDSETNATMSGNLMAMGAEDTGEPFGIITLSAEDAAEAGFYGQMIVYDGSTSVTLSISIYHNAKIPHPIPGELLPEGVPYAVDLGAIEILPETELVTDDGMAMLENAISGVTNGEKYTVKYNGIEYETTAVEQTVEGATMICLGNIGVLMGNAGTGEPFAIVIVPAEVVEMVGYGAMIVAIDGATELTISIKGKAAIIQKLDKRCLPNDSGFAKLFTVNVTGRVDARTADKTFSEITAAANDGNTIVRMLVETSTYTRDVLHLVRYTPSSVYFSTEYVVDNSGTRHFRSVRINDDNSVYEYMDYGDSGG